VPPAAESGGRTTVLRRRPNWTFVSDSFATNAIGVITLDPSDPTGNTLYVGTGEPNGSATPTQGLASTNRLTVATTGGHLAATHQRRAAMGCGANARHRSVQRASIRTVARSPPFVDREHPLRRLGSGRPRRWRYRPVANFSQNPNFPPVGLWKSTDWRCDLHLDREPGSGLQ